MHDQETVAAARTLIEAVLTPGQARETTGHGQDYGLQDRQGAALKPLGQFTP